MTKGPAPSDPAADTPRFQRSERQLWTVLPVVIVLIVGQAWISAKLTLEPWWALPLLAGACAVGSWATIITRGRNSRVERALGGALVALLAIGLIVSTLVFVWRVFSGSGLSPVELLVTGVVLWTQSVGVFGMAYWEIDGGGPVERAETASDGHWIDFMFPQQQPQVEADWRPRFGDYLYMSLTNATAFSPTDTMPMTHRAKAIMGIQSVTSAAILVVLVARAVNTAQP